MDDSSGAVPTPHSGNEWAEMETDGPGCPNCDDPDCVDNQSVMPALSLFVSGQPAPQGSKRHVGNGVLIESSKTVKTWRDDVRAAVLDRWGNEQLDTAVAVDLAFVMKRPVATPKRRTPPAAKKPDLDKLIRAILDAIGSAGVWRDDAQVVAIAASKRLADIGETTGARITIYPVETSP